MKISVLGAAGGVGQPLCLLLKQSPLVSHLACYDIVNTPGVATDLSHIATPCHVSGHSGPDELKTCLEGADLVILAAGIPRKSGVTKDDWFNTNASITSDLVEAYAKYSPKALLLVASEPINSTLAIATNIVKQAGVYQPRSILGISKQNAIRANAFIAEAKGLDVSEVNIPVIGGCAGVTILPLLSQITPHVSFTQDEIEKLTDRIQNAESEVVNAKAGADSSTLSKADAIAHFTFAVAEALAGKTDVIECAFVASDVIEAPYFASQVRLGREGVEEYLPLGELTDYEHKKMEALVPELLKNIAQGNAFSNS